MKTSSLDIPSVNCRQQDWWIYNNYSYYLIQRRMFFERVLYFGWPNQPSSGSGLLFSVEVFISPKKSHWALKITGSNFPIVCWSNGTRPFEVTQLSIDTLLRPPLLLCVHLSSRSVGRLNPTSLANETQNFR